MNDPSVPKPLDASGLAPIALCGPQHALAEELDLVPALPGDHPAWQRDVVAISARIRAVVARLEPIAVRVLTFWDHVTRSVTLAGNRHVEIDPSGCYRLR